MGFALTLSCSLSLYLSIYLSLSHTHTHTRSLTRSHRYTYMQRGRGWGPLQCGGGLPPHRPVPASLCLWARPWALRPCLCVCICVYACVWCLRCGHVACPHCENGTSSRVAKAELPRTCVCDSRSVGSHTVQLLRQSHTVWKPTQCSIYARARAHTHTPSRVAKADLPRPPVPISVGLVRSFSLEAGGKG